MEANPPPKEKLTPLSASRVKSLENCSWSYWCQYHLKLPQGQNEGAMKGEVCHLIFEVLLNEKHKDKVKAIIKAGTISASKSVERLIKKYIKKVKLPDTSLVLLHIDQMVLVGLRNDFYVKGGKLVAPEFRFDIANDKFRIKGFMDKPYIVGNEIYIDDFKSAKKKFEGDDEESNIQALFYSYAAKQLWPHLTPKVRFIFLQFPDDPMMEIEFSDDALKGFGEFLEHTQRNVNYFNERTAVSYFAADQEPHDQGFNGKLLCGFAKSPDQKKKDGTKMWHCPFKFAYDYYAVKKDGKIVYSVLTKEELRPLKEGETVEQLKYEGCPKHRSPLEGFSTTTSSPKPKYTNVLDDF
jgi:hypothetical protein